MLAGGGVHTSPKSQVGFKDLPLQHTALLSRIVEIRSAREREACHLCMSISSIVAAPLQMVSESQQYAFEVSMQTEPKIATLCQKVLSLVRSTKATTTIQVGQGFKLTTTDVEDVLGDTEKKFTLTAVCTLDNLPQYRLDPPRRGVQYALITVTSMMQETFIVDQVQLLSEEEGNAATVSLKQLMLLTRQMYAPDRKRGGEWNATFSPASAKKCRFLGRSPTDAVIS